MSLLKVENLSREFLIKTQLLKRTIGRVAAVKDVSFSVKKGETLGIVGESGSGKTTVARLILRLLKPDNGQIYFNGSRIDNISGRKLKSYRRRVQAVFQDPRESLDPRQKIGDVVSEGLKYLTDLSEPERKTRALQALKRVELSASLFERYPHQLSGGQRQRVGIARALAVSPELVVCDEPTSALDVSIQAQLINLLLELKEQKELTYVFISHDLNLVRFISDRIIVMKAGEIVEQGPADRVYNNPTHPYTQSLLAALPPEISQ